MSHYSKFSTPANPELRNSEETENSLASAAGNDYDVEVNCRGFPYAASMQKTFNAKMQRYEGAKALKMFSGDIEGMSVMISPGIMILVIVLDSTDDSPSLF